jgi:hypothetical protein
MYTQKFNENSCAFKINGRVICIHGYISLFETYGGCELDKSEPNFDKV